MNLQKIFNLYEEKAPASRVKHERTLQKQNPFYPLIGNYIISSGGKRMRPLFSSDQL